MPPKGKYTDPKLRDQVKEEIQNSDKGGAPGQWSARKAQFMASEYKKRGGDYTTNKDSGQDESQKNLSKWSEEEWQTKEGSGNAKKSDGTQKRYLPKKAWEQMDDKEKKETDDKKQAASKEGQQHVDNTDKAKSAREKANKEEHEKFENKKQKQADGKKSTGKQANGDAPRRSARGAKNSSEQQKQDDTTKKSAKQKKKDEDKEMKDRDDEEFEDPGADDGAAKEDDDSKGKAAGETKTADAEEGDEKQEESEPKAGNKRGRGSKKQQEESKGSNKKQKSNSGEGKSKGSFGSKHDSAEEPAPAASKDRLPKKGQRASWKALPGWVHGEVLEVLTEGKTVDGKSVKASKDDPRIVLKSDNGKTAVHKANAVFFED